MSDQKTSYPLYWPDGWPRVSARQPSRFGGSHGRQPSMDSAVQFLSHELELLKATSTLLSTNVPRRLDGFPYSNRGQPADPGAAVFFKLNGREVSLACDKWNRVECNVHAIAKHIEALRGQERWGVGSLEQAFRGYTALPAVGQTGGDNPWQILGLSINASREQITDAYRTLVKKFHPDNQSTGNAERFHRIQNAYDLLGQNGE